MNNFVFINNNKYDALIKKMLYFFYFVYQFFFLILVSNFVDNNPIAYKYISSLIIISFLFIVFVGGYNFFRGWFSIFEIVLYAIAGIILTISFFNYREVMVIANLFFLAAFKEEDGYKALKTYLLATILGYFSVIIIGFITDSSADVVQVRHGVSRIRYSLGFSHYILFAHYYLCALLVYFLIKRNIKYIEYIIMLLIELVIFYLSDTKAVLILVVFVILLHIIVTKINCLILNKIIGIFSVLSFAVSSISILVMTILYTPDNKFLSAINHFITGRLVVAQNAMKLQTFNLFGQTLNSDSLSALYDSVYLNILMQNGILAFIICIAFMTYFAYLSYKSKDWVLCMVLLIIAIRSSFDSGIMTVQFTPEIVLFYPLLKKISI